MITFTPLSGSARSTRTTPLAYLLQVDDVRILLDCGSPDWRPESSSSALSSSSSSPQSSYPSESCPWEDYCAALRECAPTIDLVLLSHGDLAHVGLYPYAYSRWGLKAPAYCTLPVQAMARIAVGEDVEGIRDEEDVGDDDLEREGGDGVVQESEGEEGEEQRMKSGDENGGRQGRRRMFVATIFEVHEAFDSVNVLRYSQPTHLQGKCQGLTITPFNAGHTLGGAIWKIRSPSAGTIIYAVNLNHMRERHLDGTVLMRPAGGMGVFEPLARPDLFITDAERVSVVSSRRKDRDAALLDCVTATLTSRSSLLLPCDASTRILELLVLLDQHWNYSRLKYPICLLSRTGEEMLTFVRSMMEWLGGTVSKEDVGGEGSGAKNASKRKRDDGADEDALGAFALRFKHLEFFPNPQALLHTYSSKDPKLILAVPASLSHGPSRALFADFASVAGNVVLLTQRGADGTLGRVLFNKWNDAQRAEDKWDKGKIGSNVMMDGFISLKMYSKVPLQGLELEEYLQKERAEKEKEAAQKVANARSQMLLEADEDDDESDDSDNDDSDEENEVERALDGDTMDTAEDHPPDGAVVRKKKGSGGGGGRGGGDDWGGLDAGEDGLSKHLSFDIFLKGNVSKATSFFKTADGQTQRFRMFPYIEKKRRVDEYGETIDVGMWLRTSKAFEEADDEDNKDKKRNVEEDTKKVTREAPSKFVTSDIEVQLACRLLFVDLEGLNDGRAVKTIVPQVHPRKMIIVHATNDATDALVESCANIRAMTKDIYAPSQRETIQIGQHTNSFSISLSDEMLASVKMSRFEDNEVGYVTGRVSSLATSSIPTLEPITVAAPSSAVAEPAPRRFIGSRNPVTLPKSTMIGELKLTSLKARLSSVGVQAELVGEGVLICGVAVSKRTGGSSEILENSVIVRKTAKGKVELEGSVSEVYYVVRKEIYNLYALVAA